MAMTYQEFKDHLLVYLWKQNDQDLIASLDNIIAMAESELNIQEPITQQETSITINPVTDHYTMPSDYRDIRSVNETTIGRVNYVMPEELYNRRINTNAVLPIYSIQGSKLLFAGPIDPSTGDWPITVTPEFVITYYQKVPNFKVTDQSWLADDHLALYTYAVLKHTAGFLREDARLPVWINQYDTLLTQLGNIDANKRARGVEADVPLPYPASALTYRSSTSMKR